jgi:hypothetical protein
MPFCSICNTNTTICRFGQDCHFKESGCRNGDCHCGPNVHRKIPSNSHSASGGGSGYGYRPRKSYEDVKYSKKILEESRAFFAPERAKAEAKAKAASIYIGKKDYLGKTINVFIGSGEGNCEPLAKKFGCSYIRGSTRGASTRYIVFEIKCLCGIPELGCKCSELCITKQTGYETEISEEEFERMNLPKFGSITIHDY